eukprot:TRINITY_DN18842_c0_g1_i2.p1 TRINITY_DN18842_c0_g1~~TRINITY_DN18842_c0_g1_i2.p1  ORF type:complete len:686 (+),score=110.36 TRINITY_DN18842_c0_g1_i2:36-2093(+)
MRTFCVHRALPAARAMAAALVLWAGAAMSCSPCPHAEASRGAQCINWPACAHLADVCCPTASGVYLYCCCAAGLGPPCAAQAPSPSAAPAAPTSVPAPAAPSSAPAAAPATAAPVPATAVPTRAPSGAAESIAGFANFLRANVDSRGGSLMPLSFRVQPHAYFDALPSALRPGGFQQRNEWRYVPECGAVAGPARLDAYEYQTEQLLTRLGLNIYDGAVWVIALAVLGEFSLPRNYLSSVLAAGRTHALQTIIASDPCCADGSCGFCYGDNPATQTQGPDSALFFRMISQVYAVTGAPDARCPSEREWTWNDWKPILGENAWAGLLGPAVFAYLAAGRDFWAVDVHGPVLALGKRIIPTLKAMRVGNTGAVYYAPGNTWVGGNANPGSSVSTENQVSLLAGLRALRWLLTGREAAAVLADIDSLVSGLQRYLVDSWHPTEGYFRQGGSYDPATGAFTWVQSVGIPEFAVDCQTWVGTVLGPEVVDRHFGEGASWRLWNLTKERSGYGPQPDGRVKGVGYTTGHDVFSGEWTLGAVNWLRTMARSGGYGAQAAARLEAEAEFMLQSIKDELTVATTPGASAVLYADRRYHIPFGWWANPLPSMASTAWMVAVLGDFNPFMVTGAYSADYPPPPTPTRSPAAVQTGSPGSSVAPSSAEPTGTPSSAPAETPSAHPSPAPTVAADRIP